MDKNYLASRALFLVVSICTAFSAFGDAPAVGNAAKPAAQNSCNAEDLHGQPSVRVKDIVGMYRHSVNLPPHSAFPADGKLSGYNYLAITSDGDNRLRVKLITQEIDGHECGLDNRALLCGQVINIIPSDDEAAALQRVKHYAPKLQVSSQNINFMQNLDGTFAWGYPYCGLKGGLNHSFKRSTRNQKIDNSIFNQ